MSIYDKHLPEVKAEEDGQKLPFDCNFCHRLFTFGELMAFVKPFANCGEQEAEIKCPSCGETMKVQFEIDSIH